MIHQRIDDTGNHYAVSYTGELPEGFTPKVLVQLQEGWEQCRVSMTPDQAEHMAELLLKFAKKTRECKPIKLDEVE
jgi:hypothetical protein